MNTRLYKVLGPNHRSTNGGNDIWTPGVWLPPVEGKLILCDHGYHLCRFDNLRRWLAAEIWEAEYRGEIIEGDDKVVVRVARIIRHVDTWNEVSARLFAAECAEHILPIWEKAYPHDDRPRQAIEAACLYAFGEIDVDAAAAAAAASWAAADAAARTVSWDSARAVERQWQVDCLESYLQEGE